MKKILIFIPIFQLLLFNNAQSQSAETNTDTPFTFATSYVGDWLNNTRGGIQTGSAYLGMANIKISFDSNKSMLWSDFQFYTKLANTHGNNPSSAIVGDFQTASNLETDDLTYIQELWIKQEIGKLAITIGLQDLNAEYNVCQNGAHLINNSFGIMPSLSANLPVGIFPLTSLGLNINYKISAKFMAKIAIFDGLPDDFENNPYNIKWKLKKNEGYIAISEINFSDTLFRNRATSIKIGAYFQSNVTSFPLIRSEPIEDTRNNGFYVILDQILFENHKKMLSLGIQIGRAPKPVNIVSDYWGFVLNYRGMFKNRDTDVFAFGIAHTKLNSFIHSSETTFEANYLWQLNKNFFIQPDIQYIINPSRTFYHTPDALLAIDFPIGFKFLNIYK